MGDDILFSPIENTAAIDRTHLRYTDSLGQGRFGWVMRGTYKRQPVLVQALREEASPSDQRQFCQQALTSYRSSGHPNVLNVVGTGMNHPPQLILFEMCDTDLKTFLINAQGKFN